MVKESCFCLEEMNDFDFRESFLKKESYAGSMATNNSPCCGSTFMNVTMELRKKIFSLSDILDLPLRDGSASLNKLVMGLIEDLKNLYPEINTHSKEFSDMNKASMEQGLTCLCMALRSIGDSWMASEKCLHKLGYDSITSLKENIDSHKLAETVAKSLDFMINMAREKFDMMDEDDQIKGYSSSRTNSFGKILSGSYSDGNSSCCSSPVTPTSVLPELARVDSSKVKEIAYFPYTPPLLLSLRIQAVKKLNPIDVKHLRLHFSHKDTESVEEPKQEREAKIRSFERTQGIIREEGTDSNTEKGTGVLENPNASEKMLDGIHSTDATNMLLLPPPLLQPSLPNVAAAAPPPPMQLRQKQFPNRAPVASPPPPKKSGTVLKTAQPPPPPSVPSKGPMPPPPPPMLLGSRGAPPPPPPAGAARSLRPKKANTKLKRSSQLGNLYRTLKGKVEGTNLDGKSSFGKRSGVGSSTAGGRQGMADALAEMTKRSAYFQQIDEDAQKYAKSITEMKSAISSFQTKHIDELLKFHKDVESILENLTDETQVLSRFEGFPTKKLETLRTAAALYKKLNNIITELQTWKIEGPIGQLLDKAERHFNKIKGDLDALERTKDEESKKFQSHNIHFDFNILVRIKEAMVDVSSSCMEFALKEKREAKAEEEQTQESRIRTRTEGQKKGCGKMLWRAFQFAFRVYTFAGGHDDRADELTRELAKEIESDPHHH